MRKRRILSAVLAGIMMLSAFTACGKGDDGPVKSKRTNVYKGEALTLPADVNYVNQVAIGGEWMYLYYNKEVQREYDPKTGEYTDKPVTNDSPALTETAAARAVVAETAVEEFVPVEPEDMNGDGVIDEGDMVVEPMIEYIYLDCVYRMKMDGTEAIECELPSISENSYVNNVLVDGKGQLWILESEWWNNEDYTESGTNYYLYTFDVATQTRGEPILLNDAVKESGLVSEGDYYYINQVKFDGNDRLHFAIEQGVLTLDLTGKLLGSASYTDGWINALIVSGTDMYVSVYPNNGSTQLMKYDPDAKTFTKVESEVLKQALQTYYNFDGNHPQGKIYMRGSEGIMAYDFAADTMTEVVNYINCDIDSRETNRLVYTDDGFITCYTDYNGNKSQSFCTVYTRVPDEQIEEEVIINLATTYTNYNIRRTVIKFNKRNTGVRIAVKDYNSYNNEENEWTGAATQLNNDMVTGKVPDILVFDSALPIESYCQKNLFADLNPFIDGENGIDRASLLDNILKATESNGKLNSIVSSFYMYTLTAKSSVVGTEPGWTLEEMMGVIKAAPEGVRPFFDESRSGIISNLFRYSMDSFINWETGETYFNTPGFIDLIEFLKTAPEKGYWEAYYENMGPDYTYDPELEAEMQENYELRFFKDQGIFSMQYIGDFRGFLNAVQTFGTDEITMIGYPTRDETGNGATIVPDLELGICSASKCKDEAWSFIKYLMTDEEYLDSIYTFSLNKDKMEEMYQRAEADNEYFYEMTEDDYAWYYENYSEEYVNFMKSTQRKYTAADGEKVMKILEGANRVSRTDQSVLDIVNEELSSFFGGTKSAADTADVINSRVRIYVSENS